MMRSSVLVSMVLALSLSCVPSFGQEGDCFEPHDTPGCDDPACTTLVCEQDSFCCESVWDESCVEYAEELCEDPGDVGDCKGAPTIGLGDHFFDTTASTELVDLTGFCDPGPYGDDALHQVIWFQWECELTSRYVLSELEDAL